MTTFMGKKHIKSTQQKKTSFGTIKRKTDV